VNRILTAAGRGAQLTRSLLAFGRRQMLEVRAVDANRNVANVQKLAARTLGEDIELTVVPTPDLPLIRADPAQLESAVLNLLVNARDAMPGGGKIVVETSKVEVGPAGATIPLDDIPAGTYVLLAVSDNGQGMPPEVLSRVFEPFFTTKAEGKGTGLGLSTVYGLMRQLGGQARIYSQVDHGTTVKLYLPLAEADELEATEAAEAAFEGGRGERILLVEDNELVRASAFDQIEALGYRVIAAADAKEAQALLESGESFDLLFTDMIMPGGMTGLELANAASARWPGLKVLFTSGYTERASRQMQILSPRATLMTKPYQMAELRRRLRQALDGTPYADL
jgi:CheY-like chemotaxis protein